ncbi:MAG: FMN-binding protein [Candidatus Omnitrophica bacterium]|nr:FMN-binding protein [Candidatus Omnitrophota bacterium]
MKEIIKYGIILAVICIVASGALAGVYSITKTKIITQAQAEEEAGLKQVIPQAIRFEEVKQGNETAYYKAYDAGGLVLGVAFKVSAKGYSSTIDTIVGMKLDGTIIAIKVLNQNETPGLGSRVAEDEFTGRFAGKTDVSGVDTISGATISSKSVIESVKTRAQEIREILQ